MSEASKLMESIKKDLRAILQSLPGGVPLKALLLDYKNFLGSELPYRKLGYSTADELLSDLPDAVYSQYVAGEKIYVAVADESTKHIQKLVSKQRVSSSGYPRGLKRAPSAPNRVPSAPNRVPSAHHAPKVVQLPSDASVRASSAGSRPNSVNIPAFRRLTDLKALKPTPGNSSSTSASVPASVRKDIYDFLLAYPQGVLSRQLNGAFQKSYMYCIDHYKYGFDSIESMLTSPCMTEYVSVRNTGRELKVLPKIQQPPKINQGAVTSWLNHISSADPNKNCQPLVSNCEGQPPVQSISLENSAFHSKENYPTSEQPLQNSLTFPVLPNPAIPPFPIRETTNWTVPPLLSVGTVVSHIRSSSSPPALRRRLSPSPVMQNHSNEAEEEEPESPNPTKVDVGNKLKENIRKILSQHPEGINYLVFPTKYKEEFGVEFIYQDLGVYNIMDLMSSIPDVVFFYRPNPQSSYTLYDARLKPKVDTVQKSLCQQETKVIPLPEEVKRKLVKLLEQYHPDGLSMSSIPRHYRMMYNEEFEFHQYGYSSLEMLLVGLVDDVVSMEYFDEGIQVQLASDAPLKYSAAIPKNANKLMSTSVSKAVPPTSVNKSAIPTIPSRASNPVTQKNFVTNLPSGSELKRDQPSSLRQTYRNIVHDEVLRSPKECPPGFLNPHCDVPSDACLPGRTINVQEIPARWIVKHDENYTYEEVIAAHVESPGMFWVQLKETKDILAKLMDDLETAYRMDSVLMEQYTIPPRYLQPGMLCVAKYEHDWHRAKIIDYADAENVKVSYIDYGTVADVARTGVKFLKDRFVTFPAQALEAQLANVVPLHDATEWSQEARKVFFEISTRSSRLVALLMGKIVNKETEILSLCLTDMSGQDGQQEVHINDLLVEQKLAKFHVRKCVGSNVQPPPLIPSVAPKAASVSAAPLRVPAASQPNNQDWQAHFLNPYSNSMFMFGMANAAGLYPTVMQPQPGVHNLGSQSNYPNMVPPQNLIPNLWGYPGVGMWPNALMSSNMSYTIPPNQPGIASVTTGNAHTTPSPGSVLSGHAAAARVSEPNHSASKPFQMVATQPPFHEGLKLRAITKINQGSNITPLQSSAIPITTNGLPSLFGKSTVTSIADVTHSISASTLVNANGQSYNHNNKVKDSSGEPDVNDIGSPVNSALFASGDGPSSKSRLPINLPKPPSQTPEYYVVEEDINSCTEDDADIEQLCRELDNIPLVKKRYIKLVELTPEHKVHLVFYQQELHMVGFEVSAFFWKKDVLRNMIMIHRIKVVSHIITEESDPELFAELLQYRLRNSEACTATLYPLSSVLIVLDNFKSSAEFLRKAIVREQESFNPHDSYWGSFSLSMSDAPTPRMTPGDVHDFTLGILQNRRKEIIMQLQEDQKNSALLEELNLLNSRIEMLEQENSSR